MFNGREAHLLKAEHLPHKAQHLILEAMKQHKNMAHRKCNTIVIPTYTKLQINIARFESLIMQPRIGVYWSQSRFSLIKDSSYFEKAAQLFKRAVGTQESPRQRGADAFGNGIKMGYKTLGKLENNIEYTE